MRHRASAVNGLRCAGLVLIGIFGAAAARAADTNMADAVNRKVLRVCSTPENLPYANEKGEGYENKIAEIIADELKVPIEYTWFPQGLGFVRKTLAVKRCDLVIGTAQADEFTLNTNHYYRTTYALVYRAGLGLDGVSSVFDARLKDKRIGIQAGVPAADQVAKAGLMATAKPYRLIVDTRYDNPMEEMVKDIRSGEVDVGILWGPYAGYYASRGGEKLTVVPILEEVPGTPKLEYRITMGVRMGETGWKRRINEIIAKRQGDIDGVLLEYGVPLIDEDNKLITAARR
ncbi:MAG TPA: substrate-binding domain-containing protein [Hyphomicrobiaceae bacterium]|nr:substrate-binding domain-containing protein [Hyphomicrobiaceae bacterium]